MSCNSLNLINKPCGAIVPGFTQIWMVSYHDVESYDIINNQVVNLLLKSGKSFVKIEALRDTYGFDVNSTADYRKSLMTNELSFDFRLFDLSVENQLWVKNVERLPIVVILNQRGINYILGIHGGLKITQFTATSGRGVGDEVGWIITMTETSFYFSGFKKQIHPYYTINNFGAPTASTTTTSTTTSTTTAAPTTTTTTSTTTSTTTAAPTTTSTTTTTTTEAPTTTSTSTTTTTEAPTTTTTTSTSTSTTTLPPTTTTSTSTTTTTQAPTTTTTSTSTSTTTLPVTTTTSTTTTTTTSASGLDVNAKFINGNDAQLDYYIYGAGSFSSIFTLGNIDSTSCIYFGTITGLNSGDVVYFQTEFSCAVGLSTTNCPNTTTSCLETFTYSGPTTVYVTVDGGNCC